MKDAYPSATQMRLGGAERRLPPVTGCSRHYPQLDARYPIGTAGCSPSLVSCQARDG
jgi:hypothetical protein